MERTDRSASCCRRSNTDTHTSFFPDYCNCDTVLCLYKHSGKTLRIHWLHCPWPKGIRIMERNQQRALCIQIIQADRKHCAWWGRADLPEREKYGLDKDLDEICAVSFWERSLACTSYTVGTDCSVWPWTIPRSAISQLSCSLGGLGDEY